VVFLPRTTTRLRSIARGRPADLSPRAWRGRRAGQRARDPLRTL